MRCNSLFPFVQLITLSAIHHNCENVRKIWRFLAPRNGIQRCVPLGWSGSGSVIRDHSDHGNEPMNPCPEWGDRFIWSTMISDHWCQLLLMLVRIIPEERTPRQSRILDSISWIPVQILYWTNSLSVELDLWIPIVSGIPNSSGSCIFRNPMPRIPDSTC